MSWAQSLIKLSRYEAEVLQKRLAEVVDRRVVCELKLAMLEAEGEAETLFSAQEAAAGIYRAGFLEGLRFRKAAARAEIAFSAQEAAAGIYRAGFFEGLKLRKAKIQSEIDVILIEETGARDALAEAFEAQKKYEHIAENLAIAARKETGRREVAALDELGLRKAAR